jgi:hypothetical protein
MRVIFQILGILSFILAPILVWIYPNSYAGLVWLGMGAYFNILAVLLEIKERLEK